LNATGAHFGGSVQAGGPLTVSAQFQIATEKLVIGSPIPTWPAWIHRATQVFLNEYLVSETGEVPFGGRNAELKGLDDWLFDAKAAPRLLVTAPAGRGKSALLVRWLKSLENDARLAQEGWKIAFVPISIRVGTNKPEMFLGGLAQRLAEITGKSVPLEAIRDPDALKYAVHDQLDAIAEAGQRVLVMLDGLDEALQGSFEASIIPTRLASYVRVLFSARWQVGDNDSSGWLRRLGWDRGVRVETLEVERLAPTAIADVLYLLSLAPRPMYSRGNAASSRVCLS
jgi:hypothetical protein